MIQSASDEEHVFLCCQTAGAFDQVQVLLQIAQRFWKLLELPADARFAPFVDLSASCLLYTSRCV